MESSCLQPGDVVAARAYCDPVVGDALEQPDRRAGGFVVVAIGRIARRVEPDMGGELHTLRRIQLLEALIA